MLAHRIRRERDAAEEFTSGGVGTELRYGSDGEYDGDMLVVAAGKGEVVPGLVELEVAVPRLMPALR